MPLTGNTYQGWQVDVGDFIIVDGEEIEVWDYLADEEDMIVIRGKDEFNDLSIYFLKPFDTYEEWGY